MNIRFSKTDLCESHQYYLKLLPPDISFYKLEHAFGLYKNIKKTDVMILPTQPFISFTVTI